MAKRPKASDDKHVPLEQLLGKVAKLHIRVDLSSTKNRRLQQTDIDAFIKAAHPRRYLELIVDLENKDPADGGLVDAIHQFLDVASTDHWITLDSTGCAWHPPLPKPVALRQAPAKKATRRGGAPDDEQQ